MRSAVIVGVTALLTGLILPSYSEPACAEEPNHAGVVVKFSNQDERSYCISFDSASISGIQALRLTGLEVITKPYGSMGEFVCKIDGIGSDPSSCPDPDGSHWGYFHSSGTGWTKSGLGASSYQVRCGGMDGWAWLPQGTGTAPSNRTFEQVCAGATCSSPSAPTEPSPTPSPSNAPSAAPAGSDRTTTKVRPTTTQSSEPQEIEPEPIEAAEVDPSSPPGAARLSGQALRPAEERHTPDAISYILLTAIVAALLLLRHFVSRMREPL